MKLDDLAARCGRLDVPHEPVVRRRRITLPVTQPSDAAGNALHYLREVFARSSHSSTPMQLIDPLTVPVASTFLQRSGAPCELGEVLRKT
jgi:hypothetical protein